MKHIAVNAVLNKCTALSWTWSYLDLDLLQMEADKNHQTDVFI